MTRLLERDTVASFTPPWDDGPTVEVDGTPEVAWVMSAATLRVIPHVVYQRFVGAVVSGKV